MDSKDLLYMDIAERVSLMSYAKRSKVGGVLVRGINIISFGWNGTPKGFDNNCEDSDNNTKPEVIHAEMNIIAKCASQGINCSDSTIYLTLSPCYECAKILIQSGIKKVVYKEQYRKTLGIELLEKSGIEVIKI